LTHLDSYYFLCFNYILWPGVARRPISFFGDAKKVKAVGPPPTYRPQINHKNKYDQKKPARIFKMPRS